MKKLTLRVCLRHRARFRQCVRLLSLTSAYVLLLGLAAPAWPEEKYVKSDSPVFLEATPDRALVYFVEPSPQPWTVKVYLDKTPIAFLPRKSYIGVRVEPGIRLVWGTTDSEWFEFKRGRTYLLLYIQTGQYSSAWFMDDPDIPRPLVLQNKLAHVTTPEAGLERLRAKLEKKYKKALKEAGSKGKVVLPKSFSPVVYVAESKTRFNPFKTHPPRHSMLTISEQGIEYKSKKKEVVIPVTEIRQVSLAGFAAPGSTQPWIFVRYGRAEAPKIAFFAGENYNAIFASITSAMKQAKRADVQKEPVTAAATRLTPEPSKPERQTSTTAMVASGKGVVRFEGLKGQFTIELPQGWSAYDQRKAITGKKGPTGMVIFSPVNIAEMGSDDQAKTLAKWDTGELPSFFLDRHPKKKKMSCSYFEKKEVKEVLKVLKRDPMFGRDRKVVRALETQPVTIGGCKGYRIRGEAQKPDGTIWVMDVHVVSDGKILYLFSLRNIKENYESNLGLYEKAISTVRLTATSKQ